MKKSPDAVHAHLERALGWDEAHVSFEKAVKGIPARLRGARPKGFHYSPWELVEHMRRAQHDLLVFCLDAQYVHSLKWPDDYWPARPAPPGPSAWTKSIADFTADRETLQQLVRNTALDLSATVPSGKAGQTYLRSVLLVIDHNAYHLGQLVAVRRALGCWR